MAKDILYICSNCGFTTNRWIGQCNQCNGWGTMEKVKEKGSSAAGQKRGRLGGKVEAADIYNYTELGKQGDKLKVLPTLSFEFNRALGSEPTFASVEGPKGRRAKETQPGGFTSSQVLLVGGEPGVGKSTLLLQIVLGLAGAGVKVAYVSAEESNNQVYGRITRLEKKSSFKKPAIFKEIKKNFHLINEPNIYAVIEALNKLKPTVVVFDSVQAFVDPDSQSYAGSMAQVRRVAELVTNWTKQNSVVSVLIGQVTKKGLVAGPKVLEHVVDTVLYIESVGIENVRMIRSVKNRFGSTMEVGFLAMEEDGFKDLDNVSGLVLSHYDKVNEPGLSLGVTVYGSRPLLVEVQALVTDPQYQGVPRIVVEGIRKSRLQLIVAILSKYVKGVNFSNKDIHLKIGGGIKVDDPGLDLAIAAAIVSAGFNKPLPVKTALIGELSLLGFVRLCSNMELRLREAGRFGLAKVVIGEKQAKVRTIKQIEIERVKELRKMVG